MEDISIRSDISADDCSNRAQGFLTSAGRRSIGLLNRFAMDVAHDDALQFTGELSRGVAQPGSAPALGAGGPRFKSARPDQISLASRG